MSELLPEPKARRPSASILSEPLLANRNKINDKVIIKKKDTSFIDKYFGTDTQKACFFMALTAIIYNIDTLIRLIIQHFGDRIDLIIYMIGLTLISYGGYKGYICSSSSNILNKSFYMPGQSIHPLKDNWFNIHLGTGLLVSSQSILLGSVIYLLASITQLIESPFIHITYSYSSSICNIIGGILIVISSYYNNIATYPENMLRPFDPKIVEYLENNNKQWLIRHIGTDMQMAAWSLTITSIVWFIISAITFDYFTSSSFDNYLTPLLNVICSILLGISSYYSLRQSYNEGTKFDTLLVNVFNNNKEDSQQEEDDDHNGIIYDLENGGHSGDRSLYNNNEAAAAVAAVVQEEEQHPLKNINNRDIIGLVDMQDVINESYLFINNNNWYCDDNIDEEPVIHRLTTNINNKIHNNTSSIDNNYISQNEGIYDDNNGEGDNNIIVPPPGIESITETTKIWYYHNNNNTVKCSDILNGVEALLVAAILQSKEFKLSVIGDSDIGRVSLIDEPDGKTFIYYERHPPDPPMPLCESTYCSHIGIPKDDNNEEEDSLILVEWGCIASSSSQYDNNKVIVNNNSSIVNPKVARINPYRVYYLTSLPNGKTKITTALYITIPSYHHKHNNTTLSSSPPQFLINEELRKAPEIFADLKIFLNDEESMGHVIGDLEFRIWQDIHRKITPLLSGVLVRASPAYRAMIASFPGLRANVPHSLYIHRYNNNRQGEEEDNEHPLYNTPLTLNDAITNDGILKACSIGMEFISNDYEDWILNNNNNIIHNPFNSKKQETGRRSFKLNTWRRKLKGETIDPYRIQCKSQGIDPLTLATIWWSNEGNFRIVNKDYTGIESIKDITSSSSITAVIGEGMVNNIKIYNEILKGHGTMRKRECGIISILKELSATKVMVIDYSINDIPNNINNKSLSSLVHVNIFNVYLFENDSGANTKITIAGLVPCGGKTEKLLKIMAEKEVKLQEHFMTFIYNYFTDTSQGRTLVTNTRNKILGEVWQPVLSGLSKLELQFLRANSDAFNMLVNEDNHINNNNTIEHVQQVQQQQGLNLRNKSETAASSSSTTRIEAHKSNIKMTPRRIRSRQITSIIKTEDDNEIRKDKLYVNNNHMTTAITTTTITTTKLVKEDSRTKGWSILSLNINDIIVIKNPYKVIKLRVLRGVIDIIGALLYPSNKIYKIGPSAPTISLINIKAIEEGNNGKKEYISNTYKKEYPVIIALSDIKDIIYYNNNIIRKCNNGYRIFNIPIEWYNTIDYIIKKCYNNNIIKVMVIGGKGCGKSSFIKCCINRILTKKERLNIINNKVRVIDLDCGQPDISLPGTITLYDYVDISLSPSPTSLIKTIPTTPPALKEYNNLLHYELYTGGITPSLNPIDYINKCYKLIDMAMLYSNSEDSSIPIIINTPGWFSGLGGHILTLLRYYIKPDIVINIGKNNILDNNYWYDLCNGNNPLLLSQGYILSITREEEEGLYGKDIILPSVIKDNNNNIISSSSSKAPAAPPAAAAAAARAVVVGLPKSADLRWLRYTCYFNNNIIGRPYLWHTIIPSKCFNINNNNIKLLHINNINSIKILENDNIIDIIDINNRLDGVLVALLDNNGYLLCQGVIHNIDNNNNMINVWIPSKYNNNVNNNVICYIVKGNINWSLRESSYYTSTNNNTRLCIENERYFLPYTLKNEPIGRVCNPRTDLKRRRLQQ